MAGRQGAKQIKSYLKRSRYRKRSNEEEGIRHDGDRR